MLRTRIFGGVVAGLVLSFVFAAFFTAVWSFDLWAMRSPQIGQPAPVTLRVPWSPHFHESIEDVGRTRLEYRRIIVPRGTILREDVESHRIALAYEATRRPLSVFRIGGIALLALTLSSLLASYLRALGPSAAKLLRAQIGLYVLMLGLTLVVKAILLFTALPEYWVPLSTVPLWACLYLDRRTAFILNVVLGFLTVALLRFDILLLIVLLGRGMASSLAFRDRKHPRQMLFAGAIAGVAGAILWSAVNLALDGHLALARDLSRPTDSAILACIGGGMLAGAIAVFLREPAERLLGAVGRDRLLDLTDLEQPLLQKMAREAPGSWEHARAMANLAEAAASAIGVDALLTRCGAYYHDLGKTIQPKYFVENLSHGERSPHEELTPEVSADAIMAHVVQGTKILRDGGVPEPVVEFAYTHHGTQVVEYFWFKCQEQGNPKGLTEDAFRYPGMKPRTKETAILMLVDSIEAASRTIDPPDKKKFEEMIQRVLFTKLRSGQLDECGLTTRDLQRLVVRMADTLVNMYHSRIKYPWQKAAEKAEKDEPKATVVRLPTRGDKSEKPEK
ncbi:MAG: HDIG domain-containing metalloprotein [Polyangiales bacterium]